MRKLLILSLFLLVLHTTYYDLTTGTLASNRVVTEVTEPVKENSSPFVVYQIKSGDTVLSLVEKANGTIPVSIDTIVQDFETLNEISPPHIQIGQQYKIPTYSKTASE